MINVIVKSFQDLKLLVSGFEDFRIIVKPQEVVRIIVPVSTPGTGIGSMIIEDTFIVGGDAPVSSGFDYVLDFAFE